MHWTGFEPPTRPLLNTAVKLTEHKGSFRTERKLEHPDVSHHCSASHRPPRRGSPSFSQQYISTPTGREVGGCETCPPPSPRPPRSAEVIARQTDRQMGEQLASPGRVLVRNKSLHMSPSTYGHVTGACAAHPSHGRSVGTQRQSDTALARTHMLK